MPTEACLWTEGGIRLSLSDDGVLCDDKGRTYPHLIPGSIVREIRRLSDRVAELEARTDPDALALWGQDMERKGAAAEREAICRFLDEVSEGPDWESRGYELAERIRRGEHHETTSPSTTSSES